MDLGHNDITDASKLQHYINLMRLAEMVATVAHEGQMDKGGRDYINHPQIVSSYCKTTYAKIVGWLHDVVEDTDVTLDDLRRLGFDEFLIEALRCVTKEDGYDEDEYYARIKANPIAKEVKLADLKHNTDMSRILPDAPQEFKDKMLHKNEYYKSRILYLTT